MLEVGARVLTAMVEEPDVVVGLLQGDDLAFDELVERIERRLDLGRYREVHRLSPVIYFWLGEHAQRTLAPMPKPMHETQRLSFAGAVDADGHILEPPDLWETHLEAKYRDRALRLVPDENGLEELEIGGARSRMSRRGFPSTLGAMGDPDLQRDAARPGAHVSP